MYVINELAKRLKERIRLMTGGRQVPLTGMQIGQSGIVTQIQGGRGLVNRLFALDIRPGKRITKISAMLMRGPVTIEVDRTRLAIGFGMAKRVIVELI